MRKILLVLISFLLITSLLFAGGNRWTSKPPLGSTIDWSHPLSKGLVACWLMNEERGSNIYNLVNKNAGVITQGSGGWVNTYKGKAYKFDSLDTLINCGTLDDKVMTENGPLTIVALVYPTGEGEGQLGQIINRDNSALSTGIRLQQNATNELAFAVRGASQLSRVASSGTLPVNNWKFVVVTWSGSTLAASIHIYLNGVETSYASGSNGLTLADTSANLITIGNNSIASRTWGGYISYVYLFNRVFSLSEIQQLHQDPYCFIKPPTIWSMFSTAVAAARRIWIFN